MLDRCGNRRDEMYVVLLFIGWRGRTPARLSKILRLWTNDKELYRTNAKPERKGSRNSCVILHRSYSGLQKIFEQSGIARTLTEGWDPSVFVS